jgi:UDP-glucose 4-epimerase
VSPELCHGRALAPPAAKLLPSGHVRVLVTGSSGQLGREVARQLAGDHDVLGLDLVPGPRTTHTGSVTDAALVGRLAGEVDATVHTASLHAPHVGRASEDEFAAVNVEGTRLLLEAAARSRHRRFVYTSTTSVYGGAMHAEDRAVWVTEHIEPAPRDVYDRTKLAAEALCRQAAARGLPAIVLRISRMFPEEAELVAAYRLHRGIDPRDAAAAHAAALGADLPGDEPFALLNVSARSPFGRGELVELRRDPAAAIARHHPEAPAAFAALGWRLPASIDRVYVSDEAGRVLGWRARHGLDALLCQPPRWLYHLLDADAEAERRRVTLYAPASLASEGFIHCSFRPDVEETARLYFPPGARLHALRIDPRRLGVAALEAPTPRGPMPHVFGPLRREAVVEVLDVDALGAAPDSLT